MAVEASSAGQMVVTAQTAAGMTAETAAGATMATVVMVARRAAAAARRATLPGRMEAHLVKVEKATAARVAKHPLAEAELVPQMAAEGTAAQPARQVMMAALRVATAQPEVVASLAVVPEARSRRAGGASVVAVAASAPVAD